MIASRLSAFLAPAAFAAAFAAAPEARAVTVDFDVSTDYTQNFQRTWLDTGSSGASGYNAGQQAFVHTSTASGSTIFVYDTTPDGTITNTFTDVTVSFDFSAATSGASFGVFFGGSGRGTNNLAIFNINVSGSNDTLRFFTGGSLGSSAPGTQLGTTTTLTGGGWTTSKTYKATLEVDYVTASTANVTFTISDPYTVSGALSSFSMTASGIAMASGGSEIAFRSGFTGSGSGSNVIDNISITTTAVPEPSSFAAFGGLAVLGFAALRRRRA